MAIARGKREPTLRRRTITTRQYGLLGLFLFSFRTPPRPHARSPVARGMPGHACDRMYGNLGLLFSEFQNEQIRAFGTTSPATHVAGSPK